MPRGHEDFSFSAFVKTLAANNIIIDKLMQDAYHSRIETLYPAAQTVDPTLFRTSGYYGIYFRRGCRAYIESLSVYLRNLWDTSKTIHYAFKENPDGGIIIDDVAVTQAANTTGWATVNVRRFWNYDSMFIYNKDDYTDGPHIGYYDAGERDGFKIVSPDIWGVCTERCAYRVTLSALSVGELPVGGTINTIEVPVSSTGTTSGDVAIGPGDMATLVRVYEPGENIYLYFFTNVPETRFFIECDGVKLHICVYDYFTTKLLNDWGYTNNTPGIQLLKYGATAGEWNIFTLTLPFRWKKKLDIFAVNHGDTTASVAASLNYNKLVG